MEAARSLVRRIADEVQRWRPRFLESAEESRERGAFIMHIDAPWGGGKTTFANFVREILVTGPEDKDRTDLARGLGVPYVKSNEWPTVDLPTLGKARERNLPETGSRKTRTWKPGSWKPGSWKPGSWKRMSQERLTAAPGANRKPPPPGIGASFNAWRNEHVHPYWWNFYIGVRREMLGQLSWRRRQWFRVTEIVWRLFSPEMIYRLASFAVLLMGIFGLFSFAPAGWQDAVIPDGAPKEWIGLFLAILAGGSGLQLFLSLRRGTEAVLETAGRSSDPQVLGVGDPLHRFSEHFIAFCAAMKQPIVIVIDDIDRCQPAYVVDLIRGLMTVFNAPQVIYLILGDRTWIETCFARHYSEMMDDAKADRVDFGGRFAEKAMQLSFLLPTAPGAHVDGYFASILGVSPADSDPAATAPDDAAQPIARDEDAPQGSEDAAAQDAAQPRRRYRDPAVQLASETAAIATARSRLSLNDTKDQLVDELAGNLLPSNPRQLNRLVNMVALYQASALAVLDIEQGKDEWHAMVLWILLMNRYPAAWRRLNATPGLIDRMADEKDEAFVRFLRSDMHDLLFVRPLPGRFAGARLTEKRLVKLRQLMPHVGSR